MTSRQQVFEKNVGQVVQAETVNQIHYTDRALTKAERRDLDKLIKRFASEIGSESRIEWRVIHKLAGVSHISEIRQSQLACINEILNLKMQIATDRKANHKEPYKPSETVINKAVLNSLFEEIDELRVEAFDWKRRYGKLHNKVRIAFPACLLALLAFGVYATTLPASTPALIPLTCLYQGKAYAIGSVVTMPGKRECVESDGQATWRIKK